jgi:hypothetical protein
MYTGQIIWRGLDVPTRLDGNCVTHGLIFRLIECEVLVKAVAARNAWPGDDTATGSRWQDAEPGGDTSALLTRVPA